MQILHDGIGEEYAYRRYGYGLLGDLLMVLRGYAVSPNGAWAGLCVSPYVDGIATHFVHPEYVHPVHWVHSTDIFYSGPFEPFTDAEPNPQGSAKPAREPMERCCEHSCAP